MSQVGSSEHKAYKLTAKQKFLEEPSTLVETFLQQWQNSSKQIMKLKQCADILVVKTIKMRIMKQILPRRKKTLKKLTILSLAYINYRL